MELKIQSELRHRFAPYRLLMQIFVSVLCLMSAPFVFAGSLYLPLQLSPEIEARVERLFVVANMPVMKRPIPIKYVQEAIGKTSRTHPRLSLSVKNYLDRYSASAGISHFQISASTSGGADMIAPNRRGGSTRSDYEVSASAYWVMNELVAVNVGGFATDGTTGAKDTFAEGSFISLGWDYFQADIGFRPHWWGPFQDSDMLLSTSAAALPSITLSNVKPLPFLNMNYEVFLGEMSESDEILSETRDERLSGNPLLFGTNLSINPFAGMAVGISRILQFGGADRDQSLSGLYDAYFNTKEADNIGFAGNDFGNQASSISVRYTFAGEFPLSVYMQYAGEDTSKPSDFHLGNTALMLGIHMPQIARNLDFTLETAEWQNGWYTNTNYGDGLRQHNSVIGHWGGNYKTSERDLGATAICAKLIWDIRNGQSLTFKYRELENTSIVESEFETARTATLEYARATGKWISGITLSGGNDVSGENFHQISAFIRW